MTLESFILILNQKKILLDENFHPKITGFDLSFFIKNGIECHGGTLMYQAPEYNKEVDIYSFGIMLYEIVTDSSPYPELDEGRFNLYRFQQRVVNENYLQELIEQCLSANPNDRSTIDEVLTKLTNPNYFIDDVDKEEVEQYLKGLPTTTNNKLRSENKNQQKKIQEIQEENDKLRSENKNQQKKIQEIQEENKKLHEEVKRQQKEIQNLRKEIKSTKEKGNQIHQDFEIVDSNMIKKYKKIEEIASGGGG